ncbi:MAG: hypothetical protein EOM04_00880 [Clostridia bacterium]|nr:hypothetical protein [Clostridia bacterium]
MIEKTINKNSFDELVTIALSKPNICVVAVGPPGCTRVLFFRAMRANLLKRYYSFNISALDIITGDYQKKLKEFITEINKSNPEIEGIIIYTSCSEIITGMKFEKVINDIYQKHRLRVKIFNRGPLAKRKELPRKIIKEILSEFDEHL